MYYVVYTLVWNLIAFLCHYGGSLVLLDQLQSLFLRHFMFVFPVRLRAPKWLRRPVGVSFGFGGKLISFQPCQSTPEDRLPASEVNLDFVSICCLVPSY